MLVGTLVLHRTASHLEANRLIELDFTECHQILDGAVIDTVAITVTQGDTVSTDLTVADVVVNVAGNAVQFKVTATTDANAGESYTLSALVTFDTGEETVEGLEVIIRDLSALG